jgi:hypothetical protein
LAQTSFLPEDEVAVEPAGEQNWPARADPGAIRCGCHRGRESPWRFSQRAQVPVEVLPTAPLLVQNVPTFTMPRTVAEACGIAPRPTDPDGLAVFAEALAATVEAFRFPPHPVSTTAALSATLIRTSGRFM